MAPIFAAIGITPQIIDDERLRVLRSSLESVVLNWPLHKADPNSETINVPLDIERLIALLEPWQSWAFEEQVSFIKFFAIDESCSQYHDSRSDGVRLTNHFYFGRLIFKNGLKL